MKPTLRIVSLLTLVVVTSLEAQRPTALWGSPRDGNWLEGCGSLVIHRGLSGELWSHYRPDPSCPIILVASRLTVGDNEFGSWGLSRVIRQRFAAVGQGRAHSPGWFMAGEPMVFVEGHLVPAQGDDQVEYTSWGPCDTLTCRAASVEANDLAWGGAGYSTWFGRIGQTPGATNASDLIDLARGSLPFGFGLSIAWRPDSIVISIGVRLIPVGPPVGVPGEVEERPSVALSGLRGTLRSDLVAVVPTPAQGAARISVLHSLCGGRIVRTPVWAILPQGAVVFQDDRRDGARDLLTCLRQDRVAAALNLWRPDPGSPTFDPHGLGATPIIPTGDWSVRADRSAFSADLARELVAVGISAVGADSIWRDTELPSWYIIATPGWTRDRWLRVLPQLERILGSGEVLPGEDLLAPRPAPAVIPEREWGVSPLVAAFIRKGIKASIRGVNGDTVPGDTAISTFTVSYGDSVVCMDMSCGFPAIGGIRVGSRIGWLIDAGWMARTDAGLGDTLAFAGRWPADTGLLTRLERLADQDLLGWPFRRVLTDLRVGLLRDPRSTARWRWAQFRLHPPGSYGEAVGHAYCARAIADGDRAMLLVMATHARGMGQRCAVEALKAVRAAALVDRHTAPELFLYYALDARRDERSRDTLARIAWARRDWASLGVTGPPRDFIWSDSIRRALDLPPEAGLDQCLGSHLRVVELDGCTALTAFALRSGDRRLMLYLANHQTSEGGAAASNWILMNRRLWGEPLRAGWPQTWLDR